MGTDRINLDEAKTDIENAFGNWADLLPSKYESGVRECHEAHLRVTAFLAQREADRKQAESVLASFNLARHALGAIRDLIEIGDPWRNPEILDQIQYAVEDALAQAESQPAN